MNFGRFRVSKFLTYGLIASLLSWIPVQGFVSTPAHATPAGYYQVSFDANTGTGSIAAQSVTAGSSTILPGISGMTNVNKIFISWNTAANGSGTNYAAGATYTPTSDTTLYAQWSASAYFGSEYTAPVYSFGGGTNGGASSCPAGQAVVGITFEHNPMVVGKQCAQLQSDLTVAPLTSTLRATAGYVFCPDGMVAVGEKFINSGDMRVGLICQTPPGLTDTQVETQYISMSQNPAAITRTTQAITASSMCNTGDIMVGIYTLSNLWLDAHAAQCAPWTKYSITYNKNGATAAAPASTSQNAPQQLLAVANYGGTFSGYHFGGWNTLATGLGTNYPVGYSYEPASNVTLYAQWNSTVTYDPNGATSGTAPAATAVNAPGASVTLPGNTGNLLLGGYSFGGWNTAADGTGTSYTTTYTTAGDVTLYAQWNSMITYNGNGQTSASSTVPANQTLIGQKPSTLSAGSSLSKTGYTFAGWNTAADGTGTHYAASATGYVSAGNVTLYAQWNAVVTFNVNTATTGTASSPTLTSIDGASINLSTIGSMTKSGYGLLGWNTAAAGTGTMYQVGSSYTPTANITLYAIWAPLCTSTTTYAAGNQIQTFPVGTSCAYTVPSGVTSVNVVVVGGGGGGGSNVGNGGGGGGLSAATNVSVTPGQVLSITVGAGGATATAGSSSTLVVGATTYSAGGGAGGTTWTTGSATCTAGVGKTAGGNGSTANGSAGGGGVTTQPNATMCNGVVGTSNSTSGYSVIYGSGGGGGGYNSITSPVGGLGGGGVANNGAGNGGNYVSSVATAGAAGVNGQGGGGGGGSAGNASGGAGGSGTVLIAFPYISSVTFSANGGSGSALSPSVTAASAGAPITTSDVGSLSYTGFTFSGWNTSADGTGTNVPVLSSYTPQGPVTLYAQWDYTLTYNGTTATSGTPPAQQTIPGGTDAVLLATNSGSLAESNHTFVGWNTAANGTGTLYAPYSPPTLPSPYALYNASSWNSATSTWVDLSGNSNNATSTGAPVLTTISATAGSSKTFATLGGTTSDGIKFNNPQLTNYTLCYVARYSNAGAESRIFDSSTQNWLSGFLGGNTGDFYHGTGWVSSSSGSSNTNFNVMCDSGNNVFSQGVNRDSTPQTETYLPAGLTINNGISSQPSYWQVAEVALYNSALTVDQIQQEEMYLREKYGITAATPVIPTYVSTSSNVFNTYTSTSGNATLYAQWNSLVTYDLNGATSGTVPPSQNFVDSLAGTLASNSGTLAKTGFTFGGWNTAADGSGTSYPAGSTYAATGNITLYAQWNSVITFNTNNALSGAASPATISATGSAAITLATQGTMVRTGYTFLGWATTASATTAAYASGASYVASSGAVTLYAVWSANTYAIIYNANGASGSMSNQAITAGTAATLTANAFTRTGFTFTGWYTTANGTGGTAYTAGASVTLYAGTTLYAQWSANTYAVSFGSNTANGCLPVGCSSMANQSFTAGTAFTLSTNAWYKTGYTFAGWSTSSGVQTVLYSDAQSVTFFGNTTLYAQWTANVYTLTYSPNGGTGAASVASQNWTYGPTAISTFATVGTLARTGYTFAGWSATPTGTTALTTPYTPTASATLYAIWTAQPQTVTYNGNGSTSGSMLNQTITAGSPTALIANAFSKTGYSFASWNTAADGSGATSYTISQSVTIYAPVTLYAQWTILAPAIPTITATVGNTTAAITITSSQAGTTTAGAPSSYTVTAYSGATAASTCTVIPSATSCTITGLANGTAYTFKAVATNTSGSATSVASSALTPAPFTVSYSAGVGSASTTSANTTYNTGTPVTLPTATATGYTFVGWYTAASGGTFVGTPNASYSPTASVTLYAQWTALSYTITYLANGGANSVPSAGSFTTGGSYYTIAGAGSLSKGGYTFSGWNTAADGSGTSYAAAAHYSTSAALTLYAQWSAVSESVTYALGGGTGTLPTQASLTIGQTFTVASGSALSYTTKNFSGWSDGTNTYLPGATYTIGTTTVTLTALWVPVQYVVTYATNNGSGNVPVDITHASGDQVTVLAATGVTRTGYSFAGWSNGTTTYAPSATFTMPASNITLTAQWTPLTYTITYSPNGASGSPSRASDSFVNGSPAIGLPTVGSMVKLGYLFGGWSDTNTVYTDTYTATASITLNAVWSPSTFSITYNNNGGSGTSSGPATYTTGTAGLTLSAITGVTKSGYGLSGWSTTANGTILASPFVPTANTTLYAIWGPAPIAINFAAGIVPDTGSVPVPAATSAQFGASYSLPISDSSTVTSSSSNYAFAGWNDGTSTYKTGASYVMGPNPVTFTAQWVRIYNLHFVFNGGSDGSGLLVDHQYLNNNTATIPSATPTRVGYSFTGWLDQSGTSVSPGSSTYVVTDGHYILYAQWSAVPYAVTYDPAGGTPTPASTTYTIGQQFSLASGVSRTGFSFTGWSDTSTVYGASANYTMPAAPATFTAQWSANSYQLSYDINGAGSGPLAGGPHVYNESVTVASVIPVRTGYTFQNWSYGGSTYAPGSQIAMPASDATLTAQWSLASFGVTYDLAGGGSTLPTPSSVAFGATFTLASTPTYANRTFLGWSDGTSTYGAGATYTMGTSAVTLTAQWSGATYAVTYSISGGTGTVPSAQVDAPATAINLAYSTGFTKSGFTFSSWSDGVHTYPAHATFTVPSANTALIAVWAVALPVTPTAPTAVAGNGSATISLGTPAATGGGAPTSYTMTAYNGSTAAGTCTVTSPATSCVIAGLTNGTAYTFTATANNSTGSSSPSAPSAPVTPATVPNPPTNVVVTPGPQKAIITFDAAVNNGSPVTSYTVYASTGQTCTVNAPFTLPIGCTITGLTNGTPVDFVVTATNAVGTSVPSPDPTTTPADVPLAPAAVTATSITGTTASVSITAPTSDGGNAITSYTITATSTNGNSPITLTVPAAAISSASILTGLTPGATYTVGVVATNQVGPGPSASASPITQPAVAPSAPAITSATSSTSTTATITVSAPTSTGSATATITGYTATITPVGGGAAVTATSSTTAISATGLLPGTAYSVVVSATNSSSLTGAASSASTFTTPIGVSTSVATLSTTYGTTIAPITTTISASSPTGTTYSIAPTLPASLSFSTSTGTISGTVTTAQSATNYTITAHATITGGGTATGTAVVSIAIAATVPAAPAAVSGAVLTSSTAAITISASPNDGGSAITKYTITATPTSGTPVVQDVLPSAITSAVILTRLTDRTTYTISVVATNAVGVGVSTTAAGSLTTPEPTPTVVSVAPSSGITTGGTSIVITGTNFASATTVSVGAQTCAVTAWTSTTLTCTTPFGNAGAVDVVVTNPDLQQATLANGFTYFAPLSATAPISSLVIEQGAALSAFAPATANGGQGTITYSISPTPLPAGLSFDPATGKLSGTPTGSFTALSFTVTATDGASATASSTFTLTSDPAITSTSNVASTTMIAGTAAVAFAPVTAGAGSAPYTYSATGLPAGLSIDPLTGVISGTPTTVQSAVTATITATDSLGGTTSATTSITVLAPLSAHAASTSTSLVRNQAASFTPVSALGGSGGNVFTIAPTLPAGMTFDSNTGLISGTPTTITGAATFTVTITDSRGESSSASFSLAVLTDIAPLTSSTNTANISATIGNAITPLNPINIAGGTAPVTYSISPALPAGLSLDPTTGIISGTPTGLSSSTTYTVTATDSGSPVQSTTATFTLEVDAVVVLQAAPVTPTQPRSTAPVIPSIVTPPAPITIIKAIPFVPKTPLAPPAQKPSPASKSGTSQGSASTSSGIPQEHGTIYFASGSAALSAQEKAVLKQIAAQLNKAPGTQVILDGFTDVMGGTDNLKLSIQRAQSVLTYLRILVKNKKISVAGFASKNPVIPGESPAALAKNRRVEIYTK